MLLVITVPFKAVLFKVYAVSPQFLQKLHAPSELRFWNHVPESHQLFLNCRQRQKTKLQRYQSKQQREIRLDKRGNGRKQKKKKKKVIWTHKIILLCIW